MARYRLSYECFFSLTFLCLSQKALIDPAREFRLETSVMVSKQEKIRKVPRQLFLFNDLLIIAKKKDSKTKEKDASVNSAPSAKPFFFVKSWLPLVEVLTRNLEDDPGYIPISSKVMTS